MNTTINSITRQQLAIDRRVSHTAKLFGVHFPLRFGAYVYAVTSRLAAEYHGGYWQFYTLSNGGFYMAPHADRLFRVSCDNGYEGNLSVDALGIAACLYVYSQLSFDSDGAFAEMCTEQAHAEARGSLGAID